MLEWVPHGFACRDFGMLQVILLCWVLQTNAFCDVARLICLRYFDFDVVQLTFDVSSINFSCCNRSRCMLHQLLL